MTLYHTILLAVVCSAFAGVRGNLSSSPLSSAAILGDTVWLNCTGSLADNNDHAYTWLFTPLSSSPYVIVDNCQVHPSYAALYETEVTADNGCRLGVRNVNYPSAGLYTCQHAFDQGSADLVILNANSSCTYGPSDAVGGEDVTISCFLNFNGNRSPRMDFRSETGAVYSNATIGYFSNQVTGRVTFPVFPPIARLVTANTFFDAPITFQFSWTLPSFRIQFPPTSTGIDVAGESCETFYANHTVLTCTADSWPPPSFTWLDVDSGLTYNGPQITLSKLGSNHFRCTAQNQIRGVTYNETHEVMLTIEAGEPSTCPPEPETTETTTTEPTTTTTTEPTTSFIPINECGSRFRVAPPSAPIEAGYNLMCYINRTDTKWLNTQCVDMLQNLPGVGDYQALTSRGGRAGCLLLTSPEDIWTGANSACFPGYQITGVLGSCPTCTKLVMCIQLPPVPLGTDD